MTRVAVITPILPVPQDRTRGRFIYETAKALSAQADVRVFLTQARYPQALAPQGQASLLVGADFRLPDLDVEALTYPALPLVSRLSNGLAAAWQLRPRLKAFAPDLVIGYWVYPEGAGAVRAARSLGCPAMIGALGTDLNGRTGLNGWLTRQALHSADAIINVSQAMTRHTVSHFGVPAGRVHTVINGINTAVFHPRAQSTVRQAAGIPPEAPLLIYVGRLIEAKGLRELIEAFAAVKAAVAGARLAVIGEGPFRSVLEALIRDAGLAGEVHLIGGQLPDEVAQWASTAQALTLPSWTEGYPNVLVEALACGCPIVATDVGGIPEIVTAERGLLVPPRQSVPLAKALIQALNTHWDRPALAASMQRSWDDVARETLAIGLTLGHGRAN
jgi:teichuronic acid biosynthesis glycosyltransferase TuaC